MCNRECIIKRRAHSLTVILSFSEESPGLMLLEGILRSVLETSLEDDRAGDSRLTSQERRACYAVMLSESETSPKMRLTMRSFGHYVPSRMTGVQKGMHNKKACPFASCHSEL